MVEKGALRMFEKAMEIEREGIVQTYLQGWVSGRVFDKSVKPADVLSGEETAEQILNMAIGLEKDSIAFYAGIRSMVPEERGAEGSG